MALLMLANWLLLIEPVWNRNRYSCRDALSVLQSFNRTSMESKPALTQTCYTSVLKLLIEPVWNRNVLWGGRYVFYIFF